MSDSVQSLERILLTQISALEAELMKYSEISADTTLVTVDMPMVGIQKKSTTRYSQNLRDRCQLIQLASVLLLHGNVENSLAPFKNLDEAVTRLGCDDPFCKHLSRVRYFVESVED